MFLFQHVKKLEALLRSLLFLNVDNFLKPKHNTYTVG